MIRKIVLLSSILMVASLMLTSCSNGASKIDPAVIAGLDADYYIDYKNGTIPIGDLPIGTRVVDPSWKWEYRLGVNYGDIGLDGNPTQEGEVKPVTWIVVAKDHYDGLEPHVTLLSEELIGLHAFDNSTDRDHEGAPLGYNHWGDSGTANATRGLRPWLNSSGIHSGEGFYRAFSDSFKAAVLETTVPNREWEKGYDYSTKDKVFLPSTTELGDSTDELTYQIGTAYPYFSGEGDAKRTALHSGEAQWYWTRSPVSGLGFFVRCIDYAGEFDFYLATDGGNAARPALNLESGTLVSEITN